MKPIDEALEKKDGDVLLDYIREQLPVSGEARF